nr:hypothetical protein [Anaerolineae bacterium]
AEDNLGVTRTNGIPGLPGNNNFKIMKAGADKLGYKECHTGRISSEMLNKAARMEVPIVISRAWSRWCRPILGSSST